MNEKSGNEKFQSYLEELIENNKFLRKRIVTLEENQTALEKALREKDLQLQKLERLVNDANKKVPGHKHSYFENKSEVNDTEATAAVKIKKEMIENVESGSQGNFEYFETPVKDEPNKTVVKEEGECSEEETIELVAEKKKRKRKRSRSMATRKKIRILREREKEQLASLVNEYCYKFHALN